MATLTQLFGSIFPEGGDREYPIFTPTEHTPAVKPEFLFELDDVRMLVMWVSPRVKFNRNLMITGPTGCGKTELLFQFAARTGREVFRYSCHERTEFGDLLGGLSILQDGSTAFQDGPLTVAMRRGGIFLLDEVNAARPGTLIGLNGALDGAESIALPNGELIQRHPDFRVAVTGNAITRDETSSSFRGTGTMNAAFMNRFFVIEKGYLDPGREAKLLHDYLVDATTDPLINPSGHAVPGVLSKALVDFASDLREQYAKGQSDLTVSTRGLMGLCEMVALRWAKVCKDPGELATLARTTLFGSAGGLAGQAHLRSFEAKVLDECGVKKAFLSQVDDEYEIHQSDLKACHHIYIYMNPDRTGYMNPDRTGGGNAAFWGYGVEKDGDGTTAQPFHGTCRGNGRFAFTKKKHKDELLRMVVDKKTKGGYFIGMRIETAADLSLNPAFLTLLPSLWSKSALGEDDTSALKTILESKPLYEGCFVSSV